MDTSSSSTYDAQAPQKSESLQHVNQVTEPTDAETQVGDNYNLGSIDPENEVQGIKLLLIFVSIALCTFLVGLVSWSM